LKRIILASGSPRREQLLQQIGLDFISSPAYIQEDLASSVSPPDLVQLIASQKALETASRWRKGIIVAADTVVVQAGVIMGKPREHSDAVHMLEQLSGKSHQVITGICVLDVESGVWDTDFEATSVFFRSFTQIEIDAYLGWAEWADKAGAYAIQGRGALLVERIEGCYFNVVGLPLNRLHLMLRKYGIDLLGGC
jgi:septum formation protein